MIKALQKLNILLQKSYIKYIIPLLWLAVVFYFSFADFRNSNVNKCSIPQIDKLIHFVMYSTLCYILLAAKISAHKAYNRLILFLCI
jgi:uncharacterized membrane protein